MPRRAALTWKRGKCKKPKAERKKVAYLRPDLEALLDQIYFAKKGIYPESAVPATGTESHAVNANS